MRDLPSSLVRDAIWCGRRARAPGVAPAVLQAPILQDGVKGKAFYFDDTNRGFSARTSATSSARSRSASTSGSWRPQVYDDSTVLNHRENDNVGNAGYAAAAREEPAALRPDALARRQHDPRGHAKQPMPVKEWTHVTVTYDGSSRRRGVDALRQRRAAPRSTSSATTSRARILPNGGGTLGDEFLGFTFGQRFRMTPLKDGAIDEVRLFKTALTPLEVRFLHERRWHARGRRRRADELVEVLVANDPRVSTAARRRWPRARDAQNQIVSVRAAGAW